MATIKGGEKFEKAMAELAASLNQPGTLRVGFLEGSSYPDGTPTAMIAAIQNFGAPARGIPPRPFFSNMVADKSSGWGGVIAIDLKAHNYDTVHALNIVGELIQDQLKESILETNAPPLAASTIRRKGFDKPLIDTSHMINSVAKEIKT